MMQDFELMSQGTGGDEAVYRRPYRDSRAARRPIESCRFQGNVLIERRFYDWQREHRLASVQKRAFVAKPLKHFLNYGKAGDHLIDIRITSKIDRITNSKKINPYRSVDQDHLALRRAGS